MATVAQSKDKKCYSNKHVEYRSQFSDPLGFIETPRNTSDSDLVKGFKGKCGGEWDKYGLCCNPWSIESHITNIESQIIQSNEKIINFYVQLKGKMNKLFTDLKRLALSLPNKSIPGWKIGIDYANNFLRNGSNLYMFEQFANLASDADSLSYRSQMEKCWNYIKTLRIASICSICSGRSQQFFFKNRALVADDICKRSLDNCVVSLSMTTKCFRLLKWLIDSHRALDDIGVSIGVQGWCNHAKIYTAYDELVQDMIFQKLDAYAANPADATVANSICTRYFDLARQPFIYTLSTGLFGIHSAMYLDKRAADPINAASSHIEASMATFEATLAEILAQWKNQASTRQARVLQITGFEYLIFESDTEFLSATDNIFTSVIGIAGTIEYERLSPMNLSLTFP